MLVHVKHFCFLPPFWQQMKIVLMNCINIFYEFHEEVYGLIVFLIHFWVSMADFSKPSSFCLEICLQNPSILIFGVDLFTPRICLQKFKWTCSVGDFSHES